MWTAYDCNIFRHSRLLSLLIINAMSDTVNNSLPYINRDVSWMYFNHRILQEADRNDVPPLERLSFLGIYSNNLDEFFRVRMATISRIAELPGKHMKEQRHRAHDLFMRLSDMDSAFSRQYEETVEKVTGILAENGIEILDETRLDDEQKHFVRCWFRNKISGFVSPVWIDRLTEFAKESDDHIYLAVELSGPGDKKDYALIELPTACCGRFITLPDSNGKKCVIYLDDVVRFSLPMIFPGMGYTDFKAYSFKFTKDAEMEIDNDLHVGPLEKIAKAVKSRKKGATLRVIYDSEMPEQLLHTLMKKLKLDQLDSVKPSGRYHNHKDLMSFPSLGRDDLKYPAWRPVIQPELKATGSLIELIHKKDRYIHVPYHSFDYVIRLLQEAAVSKNVKSIKVTLYRVARNSKVIEALMCAARNGKKVTAVVELLARFDESSNISWAEKMQEAGIHVRFGVEGLKVHSKLILINLSKGKDIAVVGSGNFHEGNAKVYTDYFLMTADPRITKDVAEVFNFIKTPVYSTKEFKNLLVSPHEMRDRFYDLIDDEIENVKKGKPAWIKIKINHATDEEMITKLYEASRAGVKIDMLVRGNCSMVTGVPHVSENISALGIIDRYLEHSRIFVFHADGENKTFLGSADWMPRNLDNRVEVITPVFDPDIKKDILNTIEFGLRDNTHSHIVDGSGENRIPASDGEPFRSQEKLYQHYQTINDNSR